MSCAFCVSPSFIVLLFSLLLSPSYSAQGGLLLPVPRSYTTTSTRFGLRNGHPCGDNAFATEYPSLSSTYSGFVHQHLLDRSHSIVTEGSLLNVTWIPVFFSRNDSVYSFQLCLDTSNNNFDQCVTLSEFGSNRTQFNLHLDSYDINVENTGHNYHWTSITDKNSATAGQIKSHSLYVPNNLFDSLQSSAANLTAALVFEWVVSEFEVIDNCADVVVMPRDDTNNEIKIDSSALGELQMSVVDDLPSGLTVCARNPNGSAYDKLSVAAVGEKCGKNVATCAAGQCCNKYGVCGPYASNVYQYSYSGVLLESIPIYSSLPNSGAIDPMSASLSFCETDVAIDNRYVPNSNQLTSNGYDPNDFLDLCWMCSLSDPRDCSYNNWFDANNSDVIVQLYDFYDSATETIKSSKKGGNNGGESNDSQVGDLIVIVVFLIIFCVIFAFLYRAYKFSKTSRGATKMRLLDLEPDDMGKQRDISNSAIDAAGGSMHAHEDVTYGQHGYSDDSGGDENDRDPLDINDDLDNDRVGGILGRASLDASVATEKPLPQGWEEYRTDAGERYYHNPDTNVTQWDRPE